MYTVHVQVHVHREERIFLHFVYFFYCKQLLVYGLMRRLLDTSYTTRMRPGAEWGGGGIPEAQDSLLRVLRCPQS